MALDSFRVRETRKPKVEKIDLKEAMNNVLKMIEMIDSLENDDIDQRWVKENESKEFTFTTPNQNDEDERRHKIFESMDSVSFKNTSDKFEDTSLDEYINSIKPTSVTESEEGKSQNEISNNQIIENDFDVNSITESNQENNVQTSSENITPSQDDKAQLSRISELLGYQMRLTNSYGKTWFAQMTDEEKEQYIDLYTAAYNTTREDVESKIEDSIAKAYEEKISQMNQSEEKQDTVENYDSIMKTNGNQAVDKLKQIYSELQNASQEQIDEFKSLYSALSELAKSKPNSEEEKQQNLAQLSELSEKIDELQNSLTSSNTRSR